VSANQAAAAADRAADAAEDAADTASSTGSSSVEQDLAKLKDLYDKGLITQDEYESKKKDVLERL